MTTLSPTLANRKKESRSRRQFGERLDQVGWKVTDITEDDGEDFYVDIYIDGRNTGVAFYVQLKSRADLSRPARGLGVPLDIEVRHLTRWSEFQLPVVLVAWDIDRREGRWALVSHVLRELDAGSPGWRQRKTRRVHVPHANTTDDSGLLRLRRAIGVELFPLLTRGRALEAQFHFRFPQTSDGFDARDRYARFERNGGTLALGGEFIESAHFGRLDPWFQADGDFNQSLIVLVSELADKPLRVVLEITPSDSTNPITYPLSLQAVELSMSHVKLSNVPTSEAITYTFVAKAVDGQAAWTAHSKIEAGHGVLDGSLTHTRDFVRLLGAIASGGEVGLRFVDFNVAPIRSFMPPTPEWKPDPTLVQLLEALWMIQDRLNFRTPPLPNHFTYSDTAVIEEAEAIARKGRLERHGAEGVLRVPTSSPDDITRYGQPGKQLLFVMNASDEEPLEILGCPLQLGRVIRTLKGTVTSISVDDGMQQEPRYEVRLNLCDVTDTCYYPDVLEREARRLAAGIKTQFGASEAYLFGSLVWHEGPIVSGDIDLAVRGVPHERFIDALAWLARATTFDVDMVDLDGLPADLRDRIVSEGIALDGP